MTDSPERTLLRSIPAYTGITRSRMTDKHLALFREQNRSPNKVYTFEERVPPLLRVGNAIRAYSAEEGIDPSQVRVHPDTYDLLIPFLSLERNKPNPYYLYYLDGVFPYIVTPVILEERRLEKHEVECVGRQRTAPHSPVLVTDACA